MIQAFKLERTKAVNSPLGVLCAILCVHCGSRPSFPGYGRTPRRATIISAFMEQLFAPWRLEFIKGKRPDGCVFCTLPADHAHARENLVLHHGDRAFVIMNRYPYTPGHLLVVPNRHTNDFVGLTSEENEEISVLLQTSMRVLAEVYRPEGFNLGMNLGAAAGAGIREHLHWHIVPRWVGDTNFLPVMTGVRSIPELLLDGYDRLQPLMARDGQTARPKGAVQP